MKMVSMEGMADGNTHQNSGGAEIAAPAKISNAFAIETEVTARPLSGNERFQ